MMWFDIKKRSLTWFNFIFNLQKLNISSGKKLDFTAFNIEKLGLSQQQTRWIYVYNLFPHKGKAKSRIAGRIPLAVKDKRGC